MLVIQVGNTRACGGKRWFLWEADEMQNSMTFSEV